MDVFRVLGNENRRSILKIITRQRMHISALAKELDISVPVALKHVQILEQAGFVNRSRVGTAHLIAVNSSALKKIEQAYDLFDKPFTVSVKKGSPLVDALKKVASLSIKGSSEGAFISAIDGKKGYYIFEVDGKLTEKAIDQFIVSKDLEVEFKRLIPVVGKKIVVRVKP